jgi:hypothetical protein
MVFVMSDLQLIDLAGRIMDALRPAMDDRTARIANESWDVGEETEAVAMALQAAVIKKFAITEQTAEDIRTLAKADNSPSTRHLLPLLAKLPRIPAA